MILNISDYELKILLILTKKRSIKNDSSSYKDILRRGVIFMFLVLNIHLQFGSERCDNTEYFYKIACIIIIVFGVPLRVLSRY